MQCSHRRQTVECFAFDHLPLGSGSYGVQTTCSHRRQTVECFAKSSTAWQR